MLLAALSLLIPAAPSYDPWSWLVWGREVMSLDLDTVSGPSWKPLPVLITAPLSLFGGAAPDLWLVIVRAAALAGIATGAALAARLAGRLGALLAGVLLLTASWLWIPTLLGESEGVLVLCVFLAIERHLAGSRRQAFALGVAAGLIRPEAWPFVVLYALFLWRDDRSRLRWIAPGLALWPALWFLPELWGSGSLGRGAERARQVAPDAAANARRPALAVLESAAHATAVVVAAGLIAALCSVALRRGRRGAAVPTLTLLALGVAWLAIVGVLAEFGFSGITRYLVMPLAIGYVVASVGLAWALSAVMQAAPSRAAKAGLGVGAAIALSAGLYQANDNLSVDARFVSQQGHVTDDLATAVSRAGGVQRLKACGHVATGYFLVPPVAWRIHRHIEDVTNVETVPGVVLRAQLRPFDPVDPPSGPVEAATDHAILAQTGRWTVDAACR